MDFDPPAPSAETIKEHIRHLKQWFSKQPHLPKIDDDDWLETFLHNNKFSLEKTKFKLENYYSLRTKYPEVLKNRDPTSPALLRTSEAFHIAISDRPTKDNTRIIFISHEADAHAFDMTAVSKKLFMVADLMLFDKESRSAHVAVILDYRNVTYLHTLKIMSGLGVTAEIANGAYTESVKSISFINLPSIAEKAIGLMKKVFSRKLADRVHVHTSTKSTLFDLLDEDVVCSDFGGKGPSLDDLEDMLQKELVKHRKWFAEQDEVCSNELLRRKDDQELAELMGSFRKLEVD